MNIMELGALGEFIGSIAVLITLVYLALQVHQTKQAVQSASLQTGIATMSQNSQNVAADPAYTETVVKGFFDDGDLDATEWFRFGLWMTCMFHVFQQYFLDACAAVFRCIHRTCRCRAVVRSGNGTIQQTQRPKRKVQLNSVAAGPSPRSDWVS